MSKLTAIVTLRYDDDGEITTPLEFTCNGLPTKILPKKDCYIAEARCDDPDKMNGWHDELMASVETVSRCQYETDALSERARLWWIP